MHAGRATGWVLLSFLIKFNCSISILNSCVEFCKIRSLVKSGVRVAVR